MLGKVTWFPAAVLLIYSGQNGHLKKPLNEEAVSGYFEFLSGEELQRFDFRFLLSAAAVSLMFSPAAPASACRCSIQATVTPSEVRGSAHSFAYRKKQHTTADQS